MPKTPKGTTIEPDEGDAMAIVIETERLRLRQFTEGDAEALCAMCNEADILQWMPDWKGTVAQKRGWIRWIEGQYAEAHKDTARVMLAVTLKARQTFIGMVGIGNKPEVEKDDKGERSISGAML